MISHYHRTIFVHIPKCGGQSIEHIYLNELNLSWKNRAPLLLRKKTEGEKAPVRLAHLTLQGYLDNHYISKEIYNEYYKFSVVRDPYARVISLYNYLGFNDDMDINTFVSNVLTEKSSPRDRSYWFFMPQTNFILDYNGQIGLDDILKLETINNEWGKVISKTNVKTSEIPRHNITVKKKGEIADFNSNSYEIINEIYESDFSTLGYVRK